MTDKQITNERRQYEYKSVFTYTDNTTDDNDKIMENLHKQIIIDGVDVSGCSCHYNGWSQLYRDNRDMCDKGYDLECKPKENGCYHYTKCLEEQLKAKEQECEELKKLNEHTEIELESYFIFEENVNKQLDKLKQTLIEIKEVLQFYNNTTIGVDKGNGIFELEVSNDNIGKLIYCYDTNPAKEALQKISEVIPNEN